ncbi:hypothetical protein [Sediminicoccus sp. BL-A-41-H5]|uniref:hypothetical protein n=1 Tax=Sediminicoccus sp. BL-A-41-H5 TaxID=3421106 RepID=UPI003D67D3EE
MTAWPNWEAAHVAETAAFSEFSRWRWWLERRRDWPPTGAPDFGVVTGMPPTADLDVDDPTAADCI